MKRIVKKTYHLKKYFSDDIWSLDLEDFSKAKARLVRYLKVFMLTIKTFSAEKIGFQAVALSFFSTMSVVPFVAVIFAVTGALVLLTNLSSSCTPISTTARKRSTWFWDSLRISSTQLKAARWGLSVPFSSCGSSYG